MADYDVAVVGAGVHGASAAYHLAERGLRTLVIESGHPADGPTTGRSSAICRAFYTNEFLAEVAQGSLSVFADFEAQVGGPAGFHRTGALFVHGAAEAADVTRAAAALRAAGIDVEVVSPDALQRDHPAIDIDGIAIAVWEPGAGYADPVLTTTSYVAAARARGAEVWLKCIVQGIEPGAVVTLRTTRGSLTADRVLVAAGPWTRELLATCDVEVLTHAERHVVATLDLRQGLLPYVVADTVTGWYGKPEVGGRYVVGGLTPEQPVDVATVHERISDDEALHYAALLVHRFPSLADCALTRGWAGVYDVSPDWQPIIGEVATNVVIDCGSSGHGFKLAPVLGGYVAALVAGERVEELDPFHPGRFAKGDELSSGFGAARLLG
ncbi:MAG: NAD(P)/FAD-dependent oxidoreductase [Actinomycetes bacterium]